MAYFRIPQYILIYASYTEVVTQGVALQYVRQYNYLGMKLDNRLTFETYAKECIRLISHNVHLLFKLKGFVNKQPALIIYKIKISPYFRYGDIFLLKAHVKTSNRMQNMQPLIPINL